MTIEDYKTLKEWIEAELEEYREKWSDVIYHNLSDKELANPWKDDVQTIYIWTGKNVYHQSDADGREYFLHGIPRSPPEIA